MTVEQAIKQINAVLDYINNKVQYCDGISPATLKLSVKALEKQIPVKPESSYKFSAYSMRYGCCPVCEAQLNEEMKYCDECGQKLDWSK